MNLRLLLLGGALAALGACGTPERLATRSAEPPANYRDIVLADLRGRFSNPADVRDGRISVAFPGMQSRVGYYGGRKISEEVTAQAWMVCVYYTAHHWLQGDLNYGAIYMLDNEGRAEQAEHTFSRGLASLSPCNRMRQEAFSPFSF